MPKIEKVSLFKGFLSPILMYGPETGALAKTDISCVQEAMMILLESTGGNTRKERVRNEFKDKQL
jgi:hypothetical protein